MRFAPEKPRGFKDLTTNEARLTNEVMRNIGYVYDRYGFDPIETPILELSTSLGKFLPDGDRPNDGVFAFQDEDEKWMSLRYDLTAPLARYVAENIKTISFPMRVMRSGPVFRNEKTGPNRFRQFYQIDADTVGSDNILSDLEMCLMAIDAMDSIGLVNGKLEFSNRKILDGLIEVIGFIDGDNPAFVTDFLRCIDKRDRLGIEGVRDLLGDGRKDESGEFMPGLGLSARSIDQVEEFINPSATIEQLAAIVAASTVGTKGVEEIRFILDNAAALNLSDRIVFNPSVVRGLEYYTGTVFEAKEGDLTIGGGGRYNGLMDRFEGVKESIPCVGFSFGVSRITQIISDDKPEVGPILVTRMDNDPESIIGYQKITQMLRAAGVRVEFYVGESRSFKAQMKYANRRNCPYVIIQGSNERDNDTFIVKDLRAGKELGSSIEGDRLEWAKASNDVQVNVLSKDLVDFCRNLKI